MFERRKYGTAKDESERCNYGVDTAVNGPLHEARHRRGSIDQSVRQVEMTSVESNAPI
jgi:hypothetical protein